MKIIAIFILALTLSGPVLASSQAAAMPTTEAACKDAGMKWKESTGTCKPRSAGGQLGSEPTLLTEFLKCLAGFTKELAPRAPALKRLFRKGAVLQGVLVAPRST
jgi:hypothetical protein